MGYYCHFCNHRSLSARVGRRAECEACGADLHICLNCMNYSADAKDNCKEPQADRVARKDRGNFCNYFVFKNRELTAPIKSPDIIDTIDPSGGFSSGKH